MTCIVGILDKKNNNVIIGGDSAGSAYNSIAIRKDSKVFKNGDFAFGCTSSFRMIQLLRFSFKPPEINNKDIYEYMCTDFVNAVRNCFREGGFLQKDSEGVETGGTFLIGYKNRLFKIESDFQVGERACGYDAIGCGSDFALGSFYESQHLTHAGRRASRALEAAEFLSIGVSSPFIYLAT